MKQLEVSPVGDFTSCSFSHTRHIREDLRYYLHAGFIRSYMHLHFATTSAGRYNLVLWLTTKLMPVELEQFSLSLAYQYFIHMATFFYTKWLVDLTCVVRYSVNETSNWGAWLGQQVHHPVEVFSCMMTPHTNNCKDSSPYWRMYLMKGISTFLGFHTDCMRGLVSCKVISRRANPRLLES